MTAIKNLVCGPYTLDLTKKTMIMGILNATPDSFSDGGQYSDIDRALSHAKTLVEDGADIIDIGGESTRPGSAEVSLEEELSRVIPIIQAVSQNVSVPISIDTYKAEVAKQAIEAGAHIINDVWGAKREVKIAEVAATYNVPIILMHNRNNKNYQDFMKDVLSDLQESITIAKRAGVRDDQIILDPGVGFAKSFEQNLEVIQKLDQIVALGYPVLLGTSRKTFLGTILDVPPLLRDEGTGATTCYGIQQGCQIVRVHNVLMNAKMAKVTDAIIGKGGHARG